MENPNYRTFFEKVPKTVSCKTSFNDFSKQRNIPLVCWLGKFWLDSSLFCCNMVQSSTCFPYLNLKGLSNIFGVDSTDKPCGGHYKVMHKRIGSCQSSEYCFIGSSYHISVVSTCITKILSEYTETFSIRLKIVEFEQPYQMLEYVLWYKFVGSRQAWDFPHKGLSWSF